MVEDNFKQSETHSPLASKGAKRHAHASDVQDILPGKAPPGNETTGHRTHRRKPGPKRKHPREKANWMPNPYGRYPLTHQVKEFLNRTMNYYAPTTQKERTRKIKMVAKTMVELGAFPSIERWNRDDIIRWKGHLEGNLDTVTQKKYWQFLRELLEYHKNTTLSDMLRQRELKMPKSPPKDIRSLTEETVKLIHSSTLSMEGWEGDIARFVTLAYPYTGLRPSELRTQLISDIDFKTWTLEVSHPKGEFNYGRKRTIAIPTPIRQPFIDFLSARKQYLKELGVKGDSKALIPYKSRRGITHWPDARWRSLKRRIDIASNIHFSWKDYRSTFCQWAIDRGADLQAVSKLMGHTTTQTTETYYGRIKDSPAIAEMNRVFSEPRLEDSTYS